MAKSTKSNYKARKSPKIRMGDGGKVDITEMSWRDSQEYILQNYVPYIKDISKYFTVFGSGINYNLQDYNKEDLITEFRELSDYSYPLDLSRNTLYETEDGYNLFKVVEYENEETGKIETDKEELEYIKADNTYNSSYLGAIDFDFRTFLDEDEGIHITLVRPHLGGDIRGNYDAPFFFVGDDEEEVFYNFYENILSGGITVHIEFDLFGDDNNSQLTFDSESDYDTESYAYQEYNSEINSPVAKRYVTDFEKFSNYQGDEFINNTVDIFNQENRSKLPNIPTLNNGGYIDEEEAPLLYINVEGENEKWISLEDADDGYDALNLIQDYIMELNDADNGQRVNLFEDYEVIKNGGFGAEDGFYIKYPSESALDDLIIPLHWFGLLLKITVKE